MQQVTIVAEAEASVGFSPHSLPFSYSYVPNVLEIKVLSALQAVARTPSGPTMHHPVICTHRVY
jgi:hypothetical protein